MPDQDDDQPTPVTVPIPRLDPRVLDEDGTERSGDAPNARTTPARLVPRRTASVDVGNGETDQRLRYTVRWAVPATAGEPQTFGIAAWFMERTEALLWVQSRAVELGLHRRYSIVDEATGEIVARFEVDARRVRRLDPDIP